MDEILPGVHHWSARHPEIGITVHSYYLARARTALDPLLPEGAGPDSLPGEVDQVVLSIGLHTRSAPEFGVPIRIPREGMHRFEGRGITVEPFDDGEEIGPGLRARRVAGIAPDDYALHLDEGPGVIAFADAVINESGVAFVPDDLMGDDPAAVKAATLDALEALLAEEEFDALLFAHGPPIASGGRAALEGFVREARDRGA
jgi:hypothetical protein